METTVAGRFLAYGWSWECRRSLALSLALAPALGSHHRPSLDDAKRAGKRAQGKPAGGDAEYPETGSRVNYTGDLDTALASIENWCAVGATHLSINTMGAGLSGVDKHLAVLRDMASSLTPGL